MKSFLRKVLSPKMRFQIRRTFTKLYWIGFRRYCVVCRSNVRSFCPGGVVARPNALCPVCNSAERHRLIWYFLKTRTDLFDGAKKIVLHIAPEWEIGRRLQNETYLDYWSSSFDGRSTRIKLDVTDVPFPDNYFDVILCSHVLEHVSDDRKGMRELCRILKPTGWALLQVPVIPGLRFTFEDASIIDPKDRERRYGQWDHVRAYGRDYPERLREAGFKVKEFPAADVVGEARIVRHGIDTTEEGIFFCQKRMIL